MNRLHQLLIGLLVVQLVLGVIVFWPRSAPAVASGPLLGEIAAGEIVAIEILDDKDVSLRLSRAKGAGEDGWGLADADSYPADGSKITPIVEKLLAITQSRLVTTTPASHKRLQVANSDFQRKVGIETADGNKQTIFLGSSAGVQTIHVRMDGADEVYQASDLSVWEIGTAETSWVDPIYFSAAQADVTGLALRNTNGEWQFNKDAGGNWGMTGLAAGEILNTNNVTSIVSRIGSVRMKRPLGKIKKPEYGMDNPSAVITVQVQEGDQIASRTLTVGTKDEEDASNVVKSSDSDYYVSVAATTLDTLVQRTRDEFLQQPPIETPTSP